MKYKVSNCPSFVLMRTATSGTYFDMCGNAKGHIKCADCTDCIIKQVIEECDKIIIYTQNAEIDVILERSGITDAEKSELYGQCKMARKILNLFDIEEVRE